MQGEEAPKRGRPSKFRPEYCKQVEKLCRLGATNTEIADFFEVSTSTIDRWMNDHPEFRDALKRGKILADVGVADALYRRAIGCTVTKQHAVRSKDADGNERIETVKLKIEVPPDTTACIFWLKNRRPAQWRDSYKAPELPPRPVDMAVVERAMATMPPLTAPNKTY